MKNVRMPRFIEGLYRDMRDRRLLLPALALVVGLLAVPILLKSNSSGATTTAAPASSGASAAAAPAVVTQQIGVTQYRKRLPELNSKNPFHQLYTTPPKAAQLHVTSTGTGSAPATSSTPSTSSTSSTSSGVGASSPTTSSLPPVSGGTSSSVGSPSSPPSTTPPATIHPPKPTVRYYVYRVGMKVGEPGKLQARSEVKRLTMLPSSNRPLATFLGVTEDGKQAIFQISTDVESVKGDGRCVPKPATCEYLAMKSGDKVNLDYAPSGKRYNLILSDIHPAVVGRKAAGKASGNAGSGQKAPKLGPG